VIAVGVGVLVVAVIVFGFLGGGGQDLDTEAAPVEDYPHAELQMFPPDPAGRTHFPQGETYDAYNSNPPTSGPHTNVAAGPAVYEQPVPKETVVHNMEHGNVVIWYNCGGGPEPLDATECGELRQGLGNITTEANNNGKQVVMTPYPDMENRIALTAWQFLDAFDEFDESRVRTFVDTFYCHTNLEGFC
jgi:hypothetical protein